MKLLAVALCWLGCHAYAPLGQTPRRHVAVRAESEDRAEQIKKLNDMFYGTTTTDAATDASTDTASAADASNPLSDLPLWRVQWNALPGERQVYNVHVPHCVEIKLSRRVDSASVDAPDSLFDFQHRCRTTPRSSRSWYAGRSPGISAIYYYRAAPRTCEFRSTI